MEEWKTVIRERARELGFVRCGFTGAEPPADYSRFENWIAGGLHAEMRYLATERGLSLRAEPARLHPSVRSIIVLAMPYLRPVNPEDLPAAGFVASYALGDDYHEIIRDRLRTLCEFLERRTGRALSSRGFVDTAPVLEREIAARAGLGWIGRNSMLIHPALGSSFFLSEIFTDLVLPPDRPFPADRCGTCDRCVRACPTGCILPNRTIDSRRCISYWTIEHHGSIPPELRSSIGRAVFGCDLCQSVCPWNRKVDPEAEACFHPRLYFPIRDMVKEYELSEEEWDNRFRHSAVRRAGREGYRRNLLIAMGNAKVTEAEPILRTALNDPNPVLREGADWALKHIQGK